MTKDEYIEFRRGYEIGLSLRPDRPVETNAKNLCQASLMYSVLDETPEPVILGFLFALSPEQEYPSVVDPNGDDADVNKMMDIVRNS